MVRNRRLGGTGIRRELRAPSARLKVIPDPVKLFGADLVAWWHGEFYVDDGASNVTQLTDRSGAGNHMVPELVGHRPTSVLASEFNGLRIFRFAAGHSARTLGNVALGAHSLSMLVRNWGSFSPGWSHHPDTLIYNNDGPLSRRQGIARSGRAIAPFSMAPRYNWGAVAADLNVDHQIYRDGVFQTSTAEAFDATSVVNTLPMYLNRFPSSGTGSGTLDVREMVVIKRVITASEMAALHTHMAQKL